MTFQMIDLPDGFGFRELSPNDLTDVLNLIKRHNHDDYQCAAESYSRSINGQFVLTRGNDVAGVTGARSIPGTDRSFWLSWTYLDPNVSMSLYRPGILFDIVCHQLKERANARKLFAMISPTVDSGLGGGHSYGGALHSYTDYGFQTELTHRDYYAAGESMTILSYRIQQDFQRSHHQPELGNIGIFDSDEIAETDDAYYVEWDFMDGPAPPENSVPHWIDTIRNWEGRVVFIGLPGNSQTAIDSLLSQGFTRDGTLADFYEDGLDEVRLRYDL